MIFCRSSARPRASRRAERNIECWRPIMSFGDVLLTGLMLVSLFLMFVILLQRGRGGGLAGAFGGLGGQSAFGTKAGDVFTVITVVTVSIWVILACVAGARLRVEASAESYIGKDAAPAGVEKRAG